MIIKNKEVVSLKENLRLNGIMGLALDIDETLSSILCCMVEKLMEGLGNPENLTIEEITKKYKHTDKISYWQGEKAEEILENIRNSNKIHEELPLIKNADSMVNKINKIVPISAYITVRPKIIIKGTKQWLVKNNFPEATIIIKPDEVSRKNGNQWKAKVLEYLYPEILGIVDDNPDLAKHLSKNYQGTVFLYNNTEILNKDIRITPCKNWKTVLVNIEKCRLN
jgi:hypothetical protein